MCSDKNFDLKEEYINFFLDFKSLELSTIGEKGQPQSSYAPFVRDDKKNFFIYVSSLAYHTKNLIKDGRAGVMLIESEEKSENIFARKRIIFDCRVNIIQRNTEMWNKIMLKFDENFGQIVQTLRMLKDFQLFKLIPKSGRFIIGFGNAYDITGEKMDELFHLKPKK
tara:strand:+ start:384 stop:884 length:501 start_codon:yes stop_codon:yes gene_type:complete